MRLRAFEASTFTGLRQLSQLVLRGFLVECLFEAGVIAGKTLLQHLEIMDCSMGGGSTGVAELLLHLQNMQQLTYLSLGSMLRCTELLVSLGPAARLLYCGPAGQSSELLRSTSGMSAPWPSTQLGITCLDPRSGWRVVWWG